MKKLIKFKKKQPGPAGRRDPLPNRLHFLFFIVFLLFIALIVQLSYLQIANGQRISNKLAEATTKSVKGAAPRGNIYDATGKHLSRTKRIKRSLIQRATIRQVKKCSRSQIS